MTNIRRPAWSDPPKDKLGFKYLPPGGRGAFDLKLGSDLSPKSGTVKIDFKTRFGKVTPELSIGKAQAPSHHVGIGQARSGFQATAGLTVQLGANAAQRAVTARLSQNPDMWAVRMAATPRAESIIRDRQRSHRLPPFRWTKPKHYPVKHPKSMVDYAQNMKVDIFSMGRQMVAQGYLPNPSFRLGAPPSGPPVVIHRRK